MGNITTAVEELNKMSPYEIVTNDTVRAHFIQIYNSVHPSGNGEAVYERECVFFNRLLDEKKDIASKCTHFSIFNSFIELAVNGLSIEQGVRALAYLEGKNYCIGSDASGRKIYEARCVLVVSGYGELVIRERVGQIRHADNPVIVYAEDDFSYSDTDGRKSVSYTCHLPHSSRKVVACFIRITRADGSIDYGTMFEEDWKRLAEYSANQNKKWDDNTKRYVKGRPNALYGSDASGIDTGFLAAKCIKHAFTTYPKIPIGNGAILETEEPDNAIPDDLVSNKPEEPAVKPDSNPSFAETNTANGVTVDPAESDTTDDGAF